MIIFNVEVNVEMISAKWIETFGPPIRIFELTKITRLLVVIEDDLLIKLGEFRHTSEW